MLLVGAGLTCAATGQAIGWRDLLSLVAADLGEPTTTDLPEGADHGAIMTRAYALSHKHKLRGNDGSNFQETVARIVRAKTRERQEDAFNKLGSSLGRFLLKSRCELIIDLNYDNVLTNLLEREGIAYRKIVGATSYGGAFRPGLQSSVVVWKVHGDVMYPGTIVLSPLDYQRLYETHAVNETLRAVSAFAQTIWTLGLGLTLDDIWLELAAPHRRSDTPIQHVRAIWMARDPDVSYRSALESWRSVHRENVDVVVFGRDYRHSSLAAVLDAFIDELPSPPSLFVSHLTVTKNQLDDLDQRIDDAVDRDDSHALLAIASEFRPFYDALYLDLLHLDARGRVAAGWLPSIVEQGETDPKEVCKNVARTFQTLSELLSTCSDGGGLLLRCVAQAVVADLLDLLEVCGVVVSTLFHDAPRPELQVRVRDLIYVGSNPFDREFASLCAQLKTNPMHRFRVDRRQVLPLDCASTPIEQLCSFTEDQFEALVVKQAQYLAQELQFSVGGEMVEKFTLARLEAIPPLYAWGFHWGSLAKFRAEFPNTYITRKWFPVDTRHRRPYIVKGGSMRSWTRREFAVAFRGHSHPMDSDPFVLNLARWETPS